jgi:hypothetical protein
MPRVPYPADPRAREHSHRPVGVLVAQTTRILRDFITDLTTLRQDGTFVRWTRRIAVYAVALHITLTHLDQRLNG